MSPRTATVTPAAGFGRGPFGRGTFGNGPAPIAVPTTKPGKGRK